MKRTARMGKISAVVVMGLASAGAVGCTREAITEIATLSGSYLGDVVAAWSTAALLEAWGLDDDAAEDNSGSMHEHDH